MKLDENVQIRLAHTSTLVINSLHADKASLALMNSVDVLIFLRT